MLGKQNAYKGKTVAQMMLPKYMKAPDSSGINYDVVPHSRSEGQKNFALQKFRNFYQGLHVQRMVLPNDGKESQIGRQYEWNRQSSMPWGNHFMATPTDKDRLSNPGVTAARKQRQLTIPDSYGQFYAFMKALSAAFGTIQGGS